MPTSTTLSPTIRIDKAGGPEEMKLVELPVGEPGPERDPHPPPCLGLNFLDVYQRSGVYPLPLPLALGMRRRRRGRGGGRGRRRT